MSSRSIQADRLPTGDPGPSTAAVGKTSAVDKKVLTGLRNGDEGAIEQIYAEYGRVVFGYLRRTLGDPGAAEDVQQQVFTEVWKRGAGYDPERASLLTWIMQIARSRAIDNLRKRTPEPVEIDDNFPTETTDGDGFTSELNDQWQVAQLLQRLPREESDMLRARFYLGKSQTEIAEESGIALGTVKMRMVDGLRRMRELIEEEEPVR
ncbi:MAG: sigma-70 family RNA polymerase sigma factor [Thermoleophilaceae bacterium]|nr:sigma-70 family RNA polymerase sigma factor [Thermoleophilaceae bacterium]